MYASATIILFTRSHYDANHTKNKTATKRDNKFIQAYTYVSRVHTIFAPFTETALPHVLPHKDTLFIFIKPRYAYIHEKKKREQYKDTL